MQLDLRSAEIKDLELIDHLEEGGFVPGIRESRSVFEDRIRKFAQGFLLAFWESRPVGYFYSEIWASKELWRKQPECLLLGHDIADYLRLNGQTLYIASMTLDSSFRGAGMGAVLLQQSIDYMRAAFPHLKNALLIVNEHWTAARRIYKKTGFYEVMRLENFFHPDGAPSCAAIVMEHDF